MAYEAKVICDSIYDGYRLTTMQLTHPRIVHSEFMTHRMFARNASSSRAIPFETMVKAVMDDPFIPIYWGKNQAGMQAKEELGSSALSNCQVHWLAARYAALEHAEKMHAMGLHKQICNRLLEPWGWITVCVSGTQDAWSNYFALRCHPDAQPELQKQAYMAQKAYFESVPKSVAVGDWHLPYIQLDGAGGVTGDDVVLWGYDLAKISIARCARTSYLTQEGKRDPKKDMELFERLSTSKPPHASPFEHVAFSTGDCTRYGCFMGWRSYRCSLSGEYTTDFKPNHPDLVGREHPNA